MLCDHLERWDGDGAGKRFKREGIHTHTHTHTHTLMIHVVVQQKPTQHCKANVIQLKINLKNTVALVHGHVVNLSKLSEGSG